LSIENPKASQFLNPVRQDCTNTQPGPTAAKLQSETAVTHTTFAIAIARRILNFVSK
jgi:hypothetical protein